MIRSNPFPLTNMILLFILLLCITSQLSQAFDLPYKDPPDRYSTTSVPENVLSDFASSTEWRGAEITFKGSETQLGDAIKSLSTRCEASCMEASEDDFHARKEFEDRIGRIFQELLAVELENFVKTVSGKALARLSNELLAFTMQGQQFLCLNTVCLAPSFTGFVACH